MGSHGLGNLLLHGEPYQVHSELAQPLRGYSGSLLLTLQVGDPERTGELLQA